MKTSFALQSLFVLMGGALCGNPCYAQPASQIRENASRVGFDFKNLPVRVFCLADAREDELHPAYSPQTGTLDRPQPTWSTAFQPLLRRPQRCSKNQP
jgi:hypothetical protein